MAQWPDLISNKFKTECRLIRTQSWCCFLELRNKVTVTLKVNKWGKHEGVERETKREGGFKMIHKNIKKNYSF